ncbi:hypothetical protein NFI96_018690 [Prochilodus magdalenae]|nr:hypothetical protein NFI96_018690 [Prochilodus magdalenae]
MDPPLLEQFGRLKKRDLHQTYVYKRTCRAFGSPKHRERVTVAPPMPKVPVPVHRARCEALTVSAEACGMGCGVNALSYTGKGGAELSEWITERRALRVALDHLGELDGWLHRKPTLTELEYIIMDRRKGRRKGPVLPQVRNDKGESELLQKEDEDVLASLQMVRTCSETHSYPSTLGGPTGRAVECFRRQSLGEYLDSLEQCQRHKLPISQSTLQRVLLHPEDASGCNGMALKQVGSSAFMGYGGRVRRPASYINSPRVGKDEGEDEEEDESEPHKVHKVMSRRQPLAQRADPNAFWPGHDAHVRLYHPVMPNRPENVLFQLASACAVVQLLMATAASKGQKPEWKFHSCGAVCLVQDKKLHSSFIRLFSVKRAKLLWEQELYTPFEYLAPCPYFHTFPGDDCRTGLNFADEEEAGRFYTAIQKCIKSTRAQPVFMRTHSLDSTSGWLLRDKLKAGLTDSGKGSRSPSPKTPPPFDLKVANPTTGSGTIAARSFTPTSHSSISSKTLSSPHATHVSLAHKKGPLPPIPFNASANPSNTASTASLKNSSSLSIPLPPPFPAPKLNPAGIKKSASFAPRGNNSPGYLKRQRSLHLTADGQADTYCEDDQ